MFFAACSYFNFSFSNRFFNSCRSVLPFSISLFIGSIKLRKILHELYIQKDPESKVFINDQIKLLAPLWIDPLQSVRNQKLKFLLVSVPFILFIISVGIIIYTWTLPSSEIVTISNTWWIYVFAYSVCLILFLTFLKKLNYELSTYKRDKL